MIRPIAFAALLLPAAAFAQDETCSFETNSGTLSTSYELIGAEACMTSCAETDGCGAWLYTPHNFNPTGAPGECRLYGEASGKVEASNQLCGLMEG